MKLTILKRMSSFTNEQIQEREAAGRSTEPFNLEYISEEDRRATFVSHVEVYGSLDNAQPDQFVQLAVAFDRRIVTLRAVRINDDLFACY
jgi:hypothetical protein